MPSEDYERNIFRAFTESQPNFLGEQIQDWFTVNDWYTHTNNPRPDPPNDARPDIICRTTSSRVVGVELVSWLHEEQMANSMLRQRVQESIKQAIGTQPSNECDHISLVWLQPKYDRPVSNSDADGIKDQIFGLIGEVERRWPEERFWHSPQGCHWSDFSSYGLLARYFNRIVFYPRRHRDWPEDQDWIILPSAAGAFSHLDALAALLEILSSKIERYNDTVRTAVGLDEFCLLIHRDRAFLHNDPAETPLFTFEDAATEARTFVSQNRGSFDRIFLFIALESPHDRVFGLLQ
ncbi:hypothetical protein MYX82_11150 [Acidobacteria bacterium AH-259-D05]|nr:hypothetical protein [Acidobacteria bacterium AH-259-D05]